jgi:hypothetical protein
MDDIRIREGDLDQGRMRVLDAKPVNLDGFSVTNPELGLVAMRSPFDPEPSLVVRDGVVVELDGKATADFDVIDEFIARYGLDLEAAQEAMALDDEVLAGMAVDVNVPRAEVVRLIGGTTPAKLARVVAALTGRDADGDDEDARQANAEQPSARHESARRSAAHRRRRGECRRLRFPGGRDDRPGARRRTVECRGAADRKPGGHPGGDGPVLDRGGP